MCSHRRFHVDTPAQQASLRKLQGGALWEVEAVGERWRGSVGVRMRVVGLGGGCSDCCGCGRGLVRARVGVGGIRWGCPTLLLRKTWPPREA